MSITGTSPNLGLTNVGANHPDWQAAATSTALASIVNGVITAVDNSANIEVRTTDTSAPIVSTQGKVFLGKATAGSWTLAAPVAGLPSAGGNDGQRLTLISTTAAAHVVTTPASALNGSLHIATFTAAIGNCIELVALGGVWYTSQLKAVTLS